MIKLRQQRSLITILFLLFSVSAYPFDYFVGAGVQYSRPHDSRAEVFTTVQGSNPTSGVPQIPGVTGASIQHSGFDASYDSSMYPTIKMGLIGDEAPYRIEMSVYKLESDIKSFESPQTGAIFLDSLKVQALMLGLAYEFRSLSFFPDYMTPFISASVGGSNVSLDDASDKAPIGSLGIGVTVNISDLLKSEEDHVYVDIAGEYLASDKLDYELSNDQQIETSIRATTVGVSIRYRF